MTRRLRSVVVFVTTIVASTVLALPAAAAETEATGFGSGQWDGLIVTAVAGILVGILMFAITDPGGIPRADAHH